MRQGGTTMHNTRQKNLDIAKKYLEGELSPNEARELIGCKHTGLYYWANEYKRSIGEPTPRKQYQPNNKQIIKDEVANEDEISRLSSLSREELIDEVIKAKVGEARAKKGYEVKGGGENKEYVTLSNKNTK